MFVQKTVTTQKTTKAITIKDFENQLKQMIQAKELKSTDLL